MSDKDTGKFELNFKKLESLSRELQENSVSIDELVPRMKDALESIKICKDVLKKTKSQLKEIDLAFAEINEESPEAATKAER